jgi:hypothetical protein
MWKREKLRVKTVWEARAFLRELMKAIIEGAAVGAGRMGGVSEVHEVQEVSHMRSCRGD